MLSDVQKTMIYNCVRSLMQEFVYLTKPHPQNRYEQVVQFLRESLYGSIVDNNFHDGDAGRVDEHSYLSKVKNDLWGIFHADYATLNKLMIINGPRDTLRVDREMLMTMQDEIITYVKTIMPIALKKYPQLREIALAQEGVNEPRVLMPGNSY